MIDRLIAEINTALANGLYLVALNTALTLPDICGKAKYPELGTTARYKKWYHEYVGQYEKSTKSSDNMPYLSADVVYQLRCALLHQGNPNVEKAKTGIDRFELVIEAPQPYVADHHEPIIGRETFERVKREIVYRESQRGFSPTGKSLCTSKYPFSNKLFCYGCGSKFRRHYQRTAKQGDIPIWVCINHKNNGRDSCSQRPIKEKQLEEAFMRVLNRVVADGEVIIDDVLKSIDITLRNGQRAGTIPTDKAF